MEKRPKLRRTALVVLCVVTALVLATGILNSQETGFRFLFWTFQTAVWQLVLTSFLVGLLAGLLIAIRMTGARGHGKDRTEQGAG
ncbi:LapA family protein [Candidatus Fermentibacterales bacterium]|nr:LapA family protein [Candidatus Fermentibacterales bacterium]